jgi:putative membrane protein insertion efficiency factor
MKILNGAYRVWDNTIGRIFVWVLVGLIRIYQLSISKLIGPVCRYYPSCSHYGLHAVEVHGAGKGSLLAVWRILRCNPWSQGGIDEVPSRGNWPTSKSKVIENSTKSKRQVISQ